MSRDVFKAEQNIRYLMKQEVDAIAFSVVSDIKGSGARTTEEQIVINCFVDLMIENREILAKLPTYILYDFQGRLRAIRQFSYDTFTDKMPERLKEGMRKLQSDLGFIIEEREKESINKEQLISTDPLS